MRYSNVKDINDIVEFPSRYVVRDFYTNISVNGKRKNLIRSFRRGDDVSFENLEYLQRRIDEGKIYVDDKIEKIKEKSILSQEELDTLIDATSTKGVGISGTLNERIISAIREDFRRFREQKTKERVRKGIIFPKAVKESREFWETIKKEYDSGLNKYYDKKLRSGGK